MRAADMERYFYMHVIFRFMNAREKLGTPFLDDGSVLEVLDSGALRSMCRTWLWHKLAHEPLGDGFGMNTNVLLFLETLLAEINVQTLTRVIQFGLLADIIAYMQRTGGIFFEKVIRVVANGVTTEVSILQVIDSAWRTVNACIAKLSKGTPRDTLFPISVIPV